LTTIEIVTLLVQLAVPLALISWLIFARDRTVLSFALDVALAALYLALITIAGLWLVLPQSLVSVLWGVLVVVAVLPGTRRLRAGSGGPRNAAARVGLVVRGALAVAFAGATVLALLGRRPFDLAPIDVHFPLQDGVYLIVNGGSHPLVNFHLETLTSERARPYRGQSYAVDIVETGRWGSRRSGLSPDDVREFAIFGDTIHAPCGGEVVRAVDGQPDRAPGEPPLTLPGNHVILDCEGVWIVLAHMKRESVGVAPGQMVAAGDALGRVGNSGASGEPHLHVHAQRAGTEDQPLSGEPLPVTFDGRFLVRNDRFGQP
jgi:hypothetical protein